MATAEVPPIENGTCESYNSFSLIPSILDEEDEKEMANSHYDLGNQLPIQDVSTVEIQTRLVELVEENESMKDALKYNNVLMKEQLNTISEWHSQMTVSLSQQKLSLEEANLKIQELEKENAELRQKSISISQHESSPYSDGELDFEIVQAKKFKEEEELKKQLEVSEKKVFELQQLVANQNAEEERDAKKRLEESEKKVFELQQVVANQNAEVSSLKAFCETKEKENADLKSELLEHTELKLKYESLGHEIKSYQETTNQMHQLDEQRVRLLTNLQEVDNRFVQKQEAFERERINHCETKKLLKDLQEKYERVDKILQMQSKEQKQKNEQFLCEREQEAKRALEQIDGLTAKMFDLEQQVEERDEKIKILSNQFDSTNHESERIPILESQLEIFKTDLNNQKEANQRLTQELSDLRAAVSFCSICGAGNAHADAAVRGKSRRRPGSSHQEKHECPLCSFGFKDVQSLENHVNSCLDKAT